MNDYALDMVSPVRHVATELDRVAPAALSVPDLASTYRHPNPGDIARVRRAEGCASESAAKEWLMTQALAAIQRRGKAGACQLVQNGDGWRLADDVTFEQLRYQGRSLTRDIDPHVRFGDPFHPMTGRFSDNIRRPGKDDLSELRESMETFGWLPEFPAIRDERGVTLVGHRRLIVAKELGIEPVIATVSLGDGDEADATRFALALASNIGSKTMTKEERRDIAEYLYGEREWTQERIAAALNVSTMTISRDLDGVSQGVKPRQRGGRPRKPPAELPPEAAAEIAQRVEAGENVPRKKLAAEFGIGEHQVQLATQREVGRQEVRQQMTGSADDQPAPVEVSHCVCPTCGDEHSASYRGASQLQGAQS